MLRETEIRVGIVDDHALFRAGLKMFLTVSRLNVSVTVEAENGKQLLDHLAACDADSMPAVILLDLHMPIMDGMQTLVVLKKLYPSIKIIVLTMFNSDATILEAFKKGADAFIVKNVTTEDLEDAIEETVMSGRYISNNVTDLLVENLRVSAAERKPNAEDKGLTEREREVLKLMCSDLTYAQIAEQIFVSARTVDTMRDRIFNKLNVMSRVGAVLWAIRNEVVVADLPGETTNPFFDKVNNFIKHVRFSKP